MALHMMYHPSFYFASITGYIGPGAKCGTLINPHKSATIIVKIPNGEKAITLKGPGIDGNITLTTSSLVDIALQIRDNRFFEYPEGIDFIFIDEDYNLFCIPRLAKKEVMT